MKSRGVHPELIFLCFQYLILSSVTESKAQNLGLPTKTKTLANGTTLVAPAEKGPPKEVTDAADKSSIVSVCVRENAELDCPLTGNPPPIYEWFKGNDRITQVWSRFEGTDQVRLLIRSVTHEDSGTYRCEAVNGFGSKNFSIELNVTGEDPLKNNFLKSTNKRSSYNGSSPEIILGHLPAERSMKQGKGKNLMLKCEAKGNPRPNVTWYKDLQNLTSSKDSIATLKLFNLTEKDDGIYRCEATNKWGKAVYEMALKVSEAWQGAAEILELNPSNLTLFPGQSGRITCSARSEGATPPVMLWVKRVDDPTLEPNKTNKLLYHDGIYYEALSRTDMKETSKNIYSTVLPINNASEADAGTYCCAVVGPMGFNHSIAEVIIKSDPHYIRSVQRQKSATVQRAVLWSFAFLILVVLLIVCFSRLYGCRGPLKNSSVTKKTGKKGNGGVTVVGSRKTGTTTTTTIISSSKRAASSGRKCPSLMMSIGKTQVPKRSPGETLSTTLTQTQNDVLQPLVDNNNRTISTSESTRRDPPVTATASWASSVSYSGGKHEVFCDHPYADNNSGHYSSSYTSGGSDSHTPRSHRHQHRSPYYNQPHRHRHHHHHHHGPCGLTATSEMVSSKNVNYVRAEDDSPAMYFVNEVDRIPFSNTNTLADSGVYRGGPERGKSGAQRWSYSSQNYSTDHHLEPDHQHYHHHHHHHLHSHDPDYTLPLSATHLPVPAPSWESLSSAESSNNSSIAHYYHQPRTHLEHRCHHHQQRRSQI